MINVGCFLGSKHTIQHNEIHSYNFEYEVFYISKNSQYQQHKQLPGFQ